jgi:two-component sensor histidine kinase
MEYFMKTYNQNNSGQLRWVILLLVTAVVLPTVCLLWFMGQAVKNERLAVRQKLIDVCNDNIDEFRAGLNSKFIVMKNEDIRRMNGLVNQDNIWLWTSAIKGDADGLVIYDANNKLVYPVMSKYQNSEFTDEIQEAFDLEQNGDYQNALEKYQKIMNANDSSIFPASMGIIRCLEKLGLVVETADFFHNILWSDNRKTRMKFTPDQVAMIRVKQVQWLDEHNDRFASGGMFSDLRFWYTSTEEYSAEVTIWALERILEIARDYVEKYKLEDDIEYAKDIINTEKISLACAEFINDNELLQDWPQGKWKTLRTSHGFYVIRYAVDGYDVLLVRSEESVMSVFRTGIENMAMPGIGVRLLDDTNKLLYGSDETTNSPFITADISSNFPNWKLEFYFEGDSVFDNAANKQTAIYTWTGVLVIGLMAACTCFAGGAVGRQMRLNRLKNDFIATVTHELKTPLASMRLLVDTLLEGSYDDQQQAREYLELISKENRRLTGLIDNFLTFSRMERNKQAFELEEVDAADIARAAADSIHTKFAKNNCDFRLDIAEDLPVIAADTDAMTTVLINLLDNACKYSRDDREISLRVYRDDEDVCFAVKDNGIGLSLRDTKKIFSRFYQVDSSLTRRTEGTGLGLSIVKFILDAHKATISVDSRPGKGSTFLVKMKGC